MTLEKERDGKKQEQEIKLFTITNKILSDNNYNKREKRENHSFLSFSFIHFQFTATPPDDDREATAFNNCSRRSCTPWLLFPEEEDEEDTETVAGVDVPPSFFPAEEEEKEGVAEAAGMRAAFSPLSPLRPIAPLKEEEEEEACPPLFPF
jgi:hypothetical protein